MSVGVMKDYKLKFGFKTRRYILLVYYESIKRDKRYKEMSV
jgi:hypothetical protein